MEFFYHHRMKDTHRDARMLIRTYEDVSFEKVQNAIHDIAYSLDVLREGSDAEVYDDTVLYAHTMLEELIEALREDTNREANN